MDKVITGPKAESYFGGAPAQNWASVQRPKWQARCFLFMAAVQVVWFYLTAVPSAMNLQQYELGREMMPFQGRLLMMLPLRWAHDSPLLQRAAASMTAMPGWFSHGCHTEGLVEAVVGVTSVLLTAWVAQKLYFAVSPNGVLGSYVAPLTILMVAATYDVNTVHPLRFVYDLPSLGLFALGIDAVFFRRPKLWFALVFVIATLNRETTLFLLLLEGLTLWEEQRSGRQTVKKQTTRLAMVVILLAAWVAWHVTVGRIFRENGSAAAPRLLLNLGILICPMSWPQFLGVGSLYAPLILSGRKRLTDQRLRAWLWVLPVWFGFMLFYGLLIETRVFGELIPYVASSVTLLAERELVQRASRAAVRLAEG